MRFVADIRGARDPEDFSSSNQTSLQSSFAESVCFGFPSV